MDDFQKLLALLPPSIAEALVLRGFTKLTPVQERVLDPGLSATDLRIASQTGSGKTVAVGFVLAPAIAALVEERNASGKPTGASKPYALLIAPTRELAAQLGKELGWLFAKMKVGVSVVAGGASYRDEHRALTSQPMIVVGTPGRLFDHLDRGSIDPSSVGAVVLDEADRMLELGFRDELESILAKLPAERRTHLVSATFAREVLHLANRYQKNATLVQGTVLGDANEDIEHIVHLVHLNERENALVNILLMSPGERTLMFVRMRADATDLAQRMTRAGFPALALSGELEQHERNRTLDNFRRGTVLTLVATDVAARGLDVPDVAQVIHVDAPTNADGLTHRSGRTGRAGQKGTSIVLVEPGAKLRVTEIMRRARIKATWAKVPSRDDIYLAADDRLAAELEANAANPVDGRMDALASRLLKKHEAKDLVRLLVQRTRHDGPTEPRNVTQLIVPFKTPEPDRDRRDGKKGFWKKDPPKHHGTKPWKPRDRSQESRERGHEAPRHEAPRERAYESRERTHETPRAHEAPKERAHETPKERAHETPKERAHEAPKERAHETPKERAHEAPKERKHEAPKERTHEKPRTHEAPKERAHEKPRAHEAPKERTHEKPRAHEAPKERTHEAPKERSSDTPRHRKRAAPRDNTAIEKAREAARERRLGTPALDQPGAGNATPKRKKKKY